MKNNWLDGIIAQLPVPSGQVLDYLLYRGLTDSLIEELKLKVWSPSLTPSSFSRRYGQHGKKLTGSIICPLFTPRGQLLGFEARSLKKDLVQYRLPVAKWNPALLGINRAMPRIWEGAKIWVVEGLFDYAALCRVLPPHEVVLATLKAAMTFRHFNFFARFAKGGVHLTYDNDPTGRIAIHGDEEKKGILNQLKYHGVKGVVDYRYLGKDPGGVWLKGKDQALKHSFMGG